MTRTKTFIENRWYRFVSAGKFEEIPKSETGEGESIDTQVREWVEQTGNIIVHPGQLGMHTAWHGNDENPFAIKCLTFGLSVLYQESPDVGQ